MNFTHLHVHSHYSLLDGLPKIDELLEQVKSLGMDSVALTDHGVLYGAIEFYKKAKKAGIKPIIGSEVYLAYEKMEQKRPNIDQKRYHLTLLVKNGEGYRNLVQLVTKAHLEGFYYKPRVDEEALKNHSEGLIALSGCIQGKIPRLIIENKLDEAKKTILSWQKVFGKENFFLEIQDHPNNEEQKKANKFLRAFSKETGIPLVATNDTHYLKKEDAEAQDILMQINTGSNINNPERLSLKDDDFSLRTPEEMIESFKDVPEAIKNTERIKNACNFEFELGKTQLPYFNVPEGKTENEYLEELCKEGLKKRYGENIDKKITERLNYELSVIRDLKFSSYFLIVQDFVNWAKSKRIVVGPGRGSASGSIVSYLLGITNVDPIKHGLLFERFLNPGRISGLPDIDLDFADRRRDEVIEYVAQKYGREKVAQIITFGTMASRAVIRDVGRALDYPYSYCDKLAKMIPFGMTLDESLKKVAEFKEAYQEEEQTKRLVDIAKKLEGVIRHASTHACGVVISSEPLSNYVPLQAPTQNENIIITQYEMHSIEDLGLLKMDFLGLKNLTIIEDTLARIYVVRNEKIDIENLPQNDEKTYKLLRKAETTGVFQLESQGVKRYLKELAPTRFEDIEVMIALYRPGPMELIPSYIKRKNKEERVTYVHPKLKPILEGTYGIMIYQEQLMKVAQELAGFSLSEADILRKAVGKKIKKLLDAQKEKFIKGIIENKIDKNIGEKIWEWVLPFASYGFNKCVSGETKIINADNGESVKIKELYQNRKLAEKTFSLDENNKIKESRILDVISNGKKPVFEVRTESGRKITVTDNHPFLTSSGWKKLEQINAGEKIAVPGIIPGPKPQLSVLPDNAPPEEKQHLLLRFGIISAINKKKITIIDKKTDIFWDKIISISPKEEEETFDLTIEKTHNFIANDIFVHNSHSTAYAMIAYQTAYLKAHYPVEFMASLLTSEKTDTERVAMLIEECKKMEIEVLPPNVNESLKNFTVVPGEKRIRFGLLAIKNVGENIIEKITEERKQNGQFKSIEDFIRRTSSKELNKKSLESLIKAGAFDQFAERNKLLYNLERLLEWSREILKTKLNGQIGLFKNEPRIALLQSEPLKEAEKLKWEKELLGLYISSHPLNNIKDFLDKNAFSISKINHSLVNKKVKLGGIISEVKKIITKNGRQMVFLKLEDLTGKMEITLFPSIIENNKTAIEENKIVFIMGRISERNGDLQVIADEIQEIINK